MTTMKERWNDIDEKFSEKIKANFDKNAIDIVECIFYSGAMAAIEILSERREKTDCNVIMSLISEVVTKLNKISDE